MTKEKQIEEMAISLRHDGRDCESTTCLLCHNSRHCFERKLAEAVISKGYLKASEVAEELINTALSKIQIMISSIKSQEENGNVTEFNGGAKTALEIVFKDLAELKKKYTEDGK